MDSLCKGFQDKAGCQIKGNLLANKEKLKIAVMRTSFLFLFLQMPINFQISSHSDEYLFQDVFKQNKSIHTIDVSHQRSHFPFATNGNKMSSGILITPFLWKNSRLHDITELNTLWHYVHFFRQLSAVYSSLLALLS